MKDIYNILSSIPFKSEIFLHRYIKFITACVEQNKSIENDILIHHHFCPKAKSMFPQYKNLKEHSWNDAPLTYRQHFIAHMMLWRIYRNHAMTFAIRRFSLDFKNTNSRIYAKLKADYRNFVILKTITGEIIVCDKNDPRIENENWVHFNKGTVNVKDCSGKIIKVSTDDPRIISGELVNATKGLVPVKNKVGEIFQISVNDSRYISGELVHVATGLVAVKDKNGNNFSVSINNPEYLSGELVGVSKGFITTKDKFGNTHYVSTNDSRYLSGELVGHMKDKIRIKNGDKIKMIHKNDPIPEGWFPTRIYKEKFQKWINNGVIRKKHAINDPIPDGWCLGKKLRTLI